MLTRPFPGDWIWDLAVWVSYDFVETDNASGCGSRHEFGDVEALAFL